MESSEHNWAKITVGKKVYLPPNANFWQEGVLDVVLSEYLNKSHIFTNFHFDDFITLELHSKKKTEIDI